MNFKNLSISVLDEPARKIYAIRSRIGEIRINDYKETFIMPLDSWKLRDYEQQWAESFERIKKGMDSCLVTTAQNLKTFPMVEMWLIRQGKRKLMLSNQLLLQEILNRRPTPLNLSLFTPETCYSYILFPENSAKISRWEIDLEPGNDAR